jgi:hypothetical protein
MESPKAWLGGRFDTEGLDKSLLILYKNFNKNYQLLDERSYVRRILEKHEYRKEVSEHLLIKPFGFHLTVNTLPLC